MKQRLSYFLTTNSGRAKRILYSACDISENITGFFVCFSAYQVIVLKVVDGAKELPDDYDSKLKDANNTNEKNFYIAAEIPNTPVYKKSWKFTVGDDTTHGGFVNKALERGEEYVIFQRALTRDNEVSKCK